MSTARRVRALRRPVRDQPSAGWYRQRARLTVARRVRALRRKFDLSQTDFGRLCGGLHWVSISRLERGLRKPRPYEAALFRAFARTTLGNARGVGMWVKHDVVAALFLAISNSAVEALEK